MDEEKRTGQNGNGVAAGKKLRNRLQDYLNKQATVEDMIRLAREWKLKIPNEIKYSLK